tara:strand:+ start:184 stop:507 length:324 start_codon:yes stop_codon:yes gene_type:complete
MSKFFKEIEDNMDEEFLERLDQARAFADIPFIINSAYRSPNHPLSVKNPSSSHIKGLAVDIKATDNATRFKIIEALISVGFTRIGIADTFIHVDLDFEKRQDIIWTY